MKSILIVTEQFTLGGLETHIQGEIRQLAEQGVAVHLASGSLFDAALLPSWVCTVSADIPLAPSASAEDFLTAINRLRVIIREHEIEAVHIHPFTSIIPAVAAAELEGVPYVITLHGPVSLASYGPIYDLLFKDIILSNAPLVIAVSPEVQDLVAPHAASDAVAYIPNSVSFAEANETVIDRDDKDPRWLVVSRLDAFKVQGILDFCIKAQGCGIFGVLIVGDGPAKDELSQALANSGLSDFAELAGARSDVPELMQRSSGVAGMGRVLLEGVALKKPVVLVGYDGVKGVVDTLMLNCAAKNNFSGRGLPTIDLVCFSEQIHSKITPKIISDNYLIAKVAFNECESWRRFMRLLAEVGGIKSTIISRLYHSLAEVNIKEDTPYLKSLDMAVRLARLAYNEKYYDERLDAAVSLQRQEQRLDTTQKNQVITKRDVQIASLKQAVTEREGQIAEQHAHVMTISNGASAIDNHPLMHAFKNTALGIARAALRSMPVSIATKQHLRDAFFSAIRPLRRYVHRKSVLVPPADQVAPPKVHLPSAGAARDVFVFAVIDWHFRIQRPQHIARSLAESGHRVFYFSNHFVDADEPGYQLERLPGADALFQIKLHLKGAPAIYFDSPSDQSLAMLTRSIARVIQDFSAISSLSIVQHAYWYPLVKQLPNSYRIYDCMDHHEGFGNVPAKLVEIEKEMLCSADLVTVTSSWLDDFARKHNPSVALVRNAAEYGHFVMRPEQVYKDAKGRRIIGYYGAIAEWFDLDLVRAIALEYSDCLILLVGNDTVGAGKVLADLPNVEFTGEVSYASLPFYLHAFDVCLLPFKVIPLTLATNPVKVYEYLAAGKPVVCVDLPEVGQFGDLVSRACSTDNFVVQVGVSLQESGEQKSAERRRFASEQTWGHRGVELATALKAVRMPRISVIILTFNNLELTRACLDSVLLRSDYPNLEVIVVDNASSDDTPAYLEDFARRNSDVRVVLNRENLGFAAGNNVGLSIATGDYLVLLNNDTVVTQGWVMTLLRHFQTTPSLGLLGPVTNNIGNEARIETTYLDIADMPAEVSSYTLAHMGKRYPMRNAAFFCVMFSRFTYERCGPISEDYGRGFFEDDDYCRRVEEKGLRIFCAEDVFIHHHLSASFNKLKSADRQKLFERNKATYEAKWGAWIPHTFRNGGGE